MASIITRLTRLTDSSLIVHWFTPENGLIKTVAKGALRPKSPFAGKLDLFFSGEIEITRARRGDLHTLREVTIHQWREGLRQKYLSTLLASYFCHLLESSVEPAHPDPSLHNLITRALDHIDASGPSARALRHYEFELARLLGIASHRHSAESSLREMLGAFPTIRQELMARLS